MNFVFFLLGVIVGSSVGITLMCLLQINRINYYENKIEKAKKERS
ncbi:MAG: DUF3789 domain-containing protein [Clostridiaceae bacterium]|nr:DUF3789 domain-containing protein [Clostridiaceae bacterium]